MNLKNKNGIAKIHNVRFYNLTPRSINCLALNQSKSKLALSRSDNSIEIWDIQHAALLEKTISTNSSIEDLIWSGENRLFSGGLTGELIEWNLDNLSRKNSQSVTGSSIWCIDINSVENCLAVGTEEGYLNIFGINSDDLIYNDLFDKQDGRIVCCKYDKTGDYIVTGSIDVIRIWNTKTGHAIRKMATGRLEAKCETIVWSLIVLKNFNIISGDSRGQITIWDGNLGTQIECHQVLKSDILTLAVNEDENILMCSGVEPIIRIYSETTINQKDGKRNKCWVKYLQRSVHDHDVKAIACSGDKIYSGSVDGYLGISTLFKVKNPAIIKHGPFLQGPIVSVAKEERLLLLRYPGYLELWKLGESHDNESVIHDDKSKLYSIKNEPKKLLEFRSINDELIITSILSNNGKWLLYSTFNSIRLFSIQYKNNLPTLTRIKYLPNQFGPCLKGIFSNDSKYLYICKLNNFIEIFQILDSGEIDSIGTIDITKSVKGICNFFEISSNGQYIIIGDSTNIVSVWQKDLKKLKYKFFIKLPINSCPITAIALYKNQSKLLVTFTDNKIMEYDLDEMRFTFTVNTKFVENSFQYPINNIILDERNENIIILHNDTYLYVLEKYSNSEKQLNSSKSLQNGNGHDSQLEGHQIKKNKIQLKAEDEEDNNSLKKLKDELVNGNNIIRKSKIEVRCKFRKTYEHLVNLTWLSENEIIAVGVNPVSLIEELPSVLKQKKFGVS